MSDKKKFATNSALQRKRLLNALIEAGPKGITTIQAREHLDIMMPAARIYELRHQHGHKIDCQYIRQINAQGHEHSCGRYILQSLKSDTSVVTNAAIA